MDDDMMAVFRQEATDLIESLERGLLDLSDSPEDRDLINAVFRDLHTIKGSGAMFGFADMAAFVHAFESAFDLLRSGKAVVTPEIIRLALSARDEIIGFLADEPTLTGAARRSSARSRLPWAARAWQRRLRSRQRRRRLPTGSGSG